MAQKNVVIEVKDINDNIISYNIFSEYKGVTVGVFTDKECTNIIKNRMLMIKTVQEDPCIDERFWRPMSKELAKDEVKAIEFVNKLSDGEFAEVSSCLEDVVKINHSKSFIEAFEKIAAKRNINIDVDVNSARNWL